MHEMPVTRRCLNGWWDFIPCHTPAKTDRVPQEGWLKGQYLVPSFWTKPASGVRESGRDPYHTGHAPEVYDSEDTEFLFDAFGYPVAWSKTRSGWIRRSVDVEAVEPDRRYWLVLEATMPKTHLFVNGHRVTTHIQPTLPLEADITQWLRTGENQIAVLIEDYDRDARGRAEVPTGNAIPCDHAGIWQDVWLVQRSEVTVSDVTIRTSTRERTLTVVYEVTNASDRDRSVTLTPAVRHGVKDGDPADADNVLDLPAMAISVAAGSVATVEMMIPWQDATWWYPKNPKLYWLRTEVCEDGTVLETTAERFGFREVWIDGPDVMLNGYPMHLFSDWGHKWTPFYATESWIRQWFGMIRDANMNHSRLHTHPHPPITLDLADEMGILITGEAGLHGSGGAQGASSPAYWEAAADHVRRFVRRDKNHPSLVLWSVENEMRWNTKHDTERTESEMIQAELPKLRAIFEAMDPTRPAYHEGDSSLWNERTQPILSRHYGKECAGIGWWDQKRPLLSGELALYHYAGPNNTLHLGGDAVYANFRAIDEAAAQDLAWIIEAGRTLGVCGWGPWNLSCLENLRPAGEDVALTYDDVTAPGVKPLRVAAHSSEFAFWEEGKGYTPNHSFAIQAHAFRPLAVIDRSLRSGAFTGSTWDRELFVVNDTADAVIGELAVSLSNGDAVAGSVTLPMEIERGRTVSRVVAFALPTDLPPGDYAYIATFRSAGRVLDTWQRSVNLPRRQLSTKELGKTPTLAATPKPLVPELSGKAVAVLGSGLLKDALDQLGCKVRYIERLSSEQLAGSDILILEPNTVEPGSYQNVHLRDFTRAGGCAIVLDQTTSVFPRVPLEGKPVLKAFVRAYDHPVVQGMTDDDLFAWGDAPYPLLASDAYVAHRMYRKDDGRWMLPLLDSGEGGFGTGDLGYTPLFEAPEGKGLILACQLRIVEKMSTTPTAEELFLHLLRRAATYTPPAEPSLTVLAGEKTERLDSFLAYAEQGATVLVDSATPKSLEVWSSILDVPLSPIQDPEVYQAVRVADDPLLSGVSNEDTCGIETFSYTPSTARNTRIGRVFIEPGDGLEPLLETATESCLRELMVYGGRSEALRAHTLTRCMGDEKREAAVVMGRVPVGKGAIVFNQFAPGDETHRPRLRRLAHRLRANCGIRYAGSLLDGARVPDAEATGPGYAQSLFVHNGPTDAAMRLEMQQRCVPSLERMVAMPILALGEWTEVTAEDGVWRAEGLDLSQETYLYHTIWSPSPRKNVETNLDVPNPEAFTFLDLEGAGEVSVMVNGHVYETVDLATGPATVSDIPLEMGGNHVLVAWSPPDAAGTLTMRWRNIMRRPEAGLMFGSGGSGD